MCLGGGTGGAVTVEKRYSARESDVGVYNDCAVDSHRSYMRGCISTAKRVGVLHEDAPNNMVILLQLLSRCFRVWRESTNSMLTTLRLTTGHSNANADCDL